MSTLTRGSIRRFPKVQHGPLTTGLQVTAFWLAGAILVATSHIELDRRSTSGTAAAALLSIALVSWAYTALCAPNAGASHAMAVGITWLTLAIVTEIAVTTRLGHAWYGLLGRPEHPFLRNLFLFAWIFTPVLFARGGAEA